MAHELEVIGGTGSFVSAREHAWHRLGTVLPETFDAAAAMTHAHLGGWNVRKEPLTTAVLTADGVTTLDVPGQYASVRDNPEHGRPEVLGVVGEVYEPIQNEQHADLLNTLVDESGAHFETAGSLKGGRQVFLTMRMPETVKVGGVDEVGVYLAALNSHDGSFAFRLLVTPVRIVCANTQAAALRAARSSFAIHHTKSATSRIQAARHALGLTWDYMTAFQVEADRMIDQAMTDAEFVAMTRTLWPVKPTGGTVDLTTGQATPGKVSARAATNAAQREDALLGLFTEAATNAAIRGTRWAAYQSVTEYVDHFAPVDGQRDAATVRAQRVVSGQVADIKHRAFALLAN